MLRCYSAHTENYCDGIDRLEQLLEVVDHFGSLDGPLVIGGDLNTLMHGVVRCLPFVYPGRHWVHRFWGSLGMSEAEWLEKCMKTEESAVSTAQQFGLNKEAAKRLSKLKDYFHKGVQGSTFVNTLLPWINFYAAKLDWLLFSDHFVAGECKISGHGLSDHLCVSTVATICKK